MEHMEWVALKTIFFKESNIFINPYKICKLRNTISFEILEM